MGVINSLYSPAFAVSALLATALQSHATVLKKRDTNCDVGPGWASPVLAVGGQYSDGVYTCETSYGKDHTPVTGIEVWRRGDKTGGRIAGIQFTYASGVRSAVLGHVDTSKYESSTLTMAPGEIIKNAELFGDGRGSWFGSIHIETAKQTWTAGAPTDGHNPYQINTGSGLLFGANIVTRSSDEGPGDDIASLGLLFLGSDIDHISVTDVQLENDPAGSNSGITPNDVVVGEWYNNLPDSTAAYNLVPTFGVVTSYSYSQSVSTSFGESYSVEFSAELFGIGAKTTNEFTWSVGQEKATTWGTTSSTAIACGASGTIAPSHGVKVSGTYQTGKGSFNYTSTVTIFLKDGTNFSYPEKGVFKNTAYQSCHVQISPDDDPSIVNSPGLAPIQTPHARAARVKRGPAPTPKPVMRKL